MINTTFTPEILTLSTQLFLLSWLFTMPSWWADLLAIGYERLLLAYRPGLFTRRLLDVFYEVLTCHKCLTFWSIWCITLNPFAALAGACIASALPQR